MYFLCISTIYYLRDNDRRGVHYQKSMDDVEAWTVWRREEDDYFREVCGLFDT